MPIRKNYLIGKVGKTVKEELQKRISGFREGEPLDKENIKKVGVLAIKSNFSFSMMENMPSWYDEVEQSKEFQKQSFMNEEARNWNLMTDNRLAVEDENKLDDLLIILLANKIVDFKYRKFRSALSDAVVAETWTELKNWWVSKRSKDEKDKSLRFQKSIDSLNDQELKDFLKAINDLFKEEYFSEAERSSIEDYYIGMSAGI